MNNILIGGVQWYNSNSLRWVIPQILIPQDKKTPLHYAVKKGDQAIAQSLLNSGANVDCILTK